MSKGFQCVVPKAFEPPAQLGEAFAANRIDSADPFTPFLDKPGLLQSLEMLRHGRPGDRQSGCKRIDGKRSSAQPLEYFKAGRIGECGKG